MFATTKIGPFSQRVNMNRDRRPHVSAIVVFIDCNSEIKEQGLSSHFRLNHQAKVSDYVLPELLIIALRLFQTKKVV